MISTSQGSRPHCATMSNSSYDEHPSQHIEVTTTQSAGIEMGGKQTCSHHSNEDPTSPISTSSSRTDTSLFIDQLSMVLPGLRPLHSPARQAMRSEQKMSFLRGCRLYPKAMAWSLVLSSTVIMEGFDTILIFYFFTFPAFKQAYGKPIDDAGYQISSKWQFALTTGAEAGEIFGLLMNGFLADRIGYRWTLFSSLVFLFLCINLLFFAVDIQMLLAAEILCGIPWGVFQTLSMTYAAEVMPAKLRAYLLSNINLCWIWGQLLATGVLRNLVNNTTEWSYRIPFALQWAIGVPILISVLFAPESPWWLMQHGRQPQARKSLKRLIAEGKVNVDETVAMMDYTNKIEMYLNRNDGGTSYIDAFKGVDCRRTEIACMVWVTQQVCGTSLTGWATTFYEQAGFDVNKAFDLSLGIYGLAIIGSVVSWYLLSRFGRRRLYIVGLCALFVILLIGGIIGSLPTSSGQLWTLGSLLLILTAVYDMTIGPVCYVLVAEIPSTRLRIKTVVLARTAYNLAGILINWMTPRMLSATDWNWKGKSCFFFAGTTIFCLIWCYYRLPETFGLSYLEIDILFEKKANVSKFHEVRERLRSVGYFSIDSNERPASDWTGF
ncbi:hypothetical protein ZTR_11214 [Talaromyces verruculosus]|nr:hypothetical protein ZTR_11214 [Talaromyces verruculosus]